MELKDYALITIAFVLVTLSCKKEDITQATAPGGNQIPVIFDVNVSPSPVTILSPVTLTVKARDPDGDRVSLRYKWLVNGEEKSETNNSLSKDEFKKGDTITAIVTPSDGKDDGEPYQIDIEVSNLPPKVENIEISPSNPTVKDQIKVIARAVDPEGDPVNLKYAWFVNTVQIEGLETDTLPNTYLKKGASVVVEVIPSDDESTGVSLLSPQITISNSPPIITSTPPVTVSGNRYSYHVVANDPDGDAISFSLENAPEGMTIGSKSGTLNWQLTPESRGEYTFSIIAEDTDGARAIQSVTLSF